jgi:hypothetical protein
MDAREWSQKDVETLIQGLGDYTSEQLEVCLNKLLYIPRLLISLPDILYTIYQIRQVLLLHEMFNREFGRTAQDFERVYGTPQ